MIKNKYIVLLISIAMLANILGRSTISTADNSEPVYEMIQAHAQQRILAGGNGFLLELRSNGDLLEWKYNTVPNDFKQGDGLPQQPEPVMRDIWRVGAGVYERMAIKKDGSLWTWSEGIDGIWGRDRKLKKIMSNAVMCTGGNQFGLAIKKDGTLWAWGKNDTYQLGDGTRKNRSRPVKIMNNAAYITAGLDFALAIKKDGSLWAWGDGGGGVLGDGAKKDSKRPVKVMDGVVMAATGASHALALKADGSLWTWGVNDYWQLGYGGDGSTVPVKVMDGVKTISAWWHNSMALKEDGTLWSWGDDNWGAVGTDQYSYEVITDGFYWENHYEYRCLPTKIMSDVRAFENGFMFGAALKEDDSLWFWGSGIFGWNYTRDDPDGKFEKLPKRVR